MPRVSLLLIFNWNTTRFMMNDPLAKFRQPLKTLSDVSERCTHSEEMKSYLTRVSTGNWRALYRCDFDRSYWIEEYPFGEHHGGGPSCFYEIVEDDPDEFFRSGPDLTAGIRKKHEDKKFLELLEEEVRPQECKRENCHRKRAWSQVQRLLSQSPLQEHHAYAISL